MFHSVLACELASFMELRRATCTNSTVATNQSVLLNFDSYLAKRSLREKHISERTIAGWMETQTGKRCTLVFKIGVLQQFLHYLNRLGLDAFVPETPVETDDYAPYVFSDEEMHTIFLLADNLNLARPQQCKTIQLEFSMILRLLYGCGLRIGETLALKTTDVDLDGGILVLKYTKGQKQRLVPMDPSLASILNRYCNAMGHMGKPDAYLFPGATLDQPLTIPSVQARFHRLLKKAEIVQKGRQYHERGPCLHCFRHVFAVRSFVAAEMAGRALADSVPYLSVYLGHTSLNETDKYLKYCSELYPDAIERFSVLRYMIDEKLMGNVSIQALLLFCLSTVWY